MTPKLSPDGAAVPFDRFTRRNKHQMGHEHASTTAIYSCVSSDYRTRTLRTALDATISAALSSTENGGAS